MKSLVMFLVFISVLPCTETKVYLVVFNVLEQIMVTGTVVCVRF